jgi:heat shock protein HslJ
MKPQYQLITVLITLLLVACTASKNIPDVPLQETQWQLIDIGYMLGDKSFSQTVLNQAHLHLNADGRQASGSDGCNRFFGVYALEGDKLTFGMMGSTRMACPHADLDRIFYQSLKKTSHYRINGEQLELLQNDKLLLRFRAQASNSQ